MSALHDRKVMAPLKPATATCAVVVAQHADQSTAAKCEQAIWNGKGPLSILLRGRAAL